MSKFHYKEEKSFQKRLFFYFFIFGIKKKNKKEKVPDHAERVGFQRNDFLCLGAKLLCHKNNNNK